MAFGVWVPLDYGAKQRLLDLARKERRDPRRQAVVLIERALAEAARERIADELAELEPVVAQ